MVQEGLLGPVNAAAEHHAPAASASQPLGSAACTINGFDVRLMMAAHRRSSLHNAHSQPPHCVADGAAASLQDYHGSGNS